MRVRLKPIAARPRRASGEPDRHAGAGSRRLDVRRDRRFTGSPLADLDGEPLVVTINRQDPHMFSATLGLLARSGDGGPQFLGLGTTVVVELPVADRVSGE